LVARQAGADSRLVVGAERFGAQVTSAELTWFAEAARAAGLAVEVSADLPRANVIAGRS